MERNFLVFDLSVEELQNFGIFFLAVLILVAITAKRLVPEQKKLAWIISLLNSFVMSIVGIVYVVVKIPLHPQILSFGPGENICLNPFFF